MADEESPPTPRRRRGARARSAGTEEKAAPAGTRTAADEEPADDGAGEQAAETASQEKTGEPDGADREERTDGSGGGRPGGSIVRVARRAAEHVGVLTGRHPETVVSVEPRDGDWCVGVEVVETHRIPDSADILAIYEVLVRPDGDLLSYRRVRRYTRGQVDRPWR
ncbi:gas vesicle protein [Pseudonocardia kujensis]|uniref:gas vesicle protein GvpO n=1 Tax=Pseudonocardia kujensis TaxID=1128675 RepID=UPI001E4FDBB3|nr:gas vesicle protein [Pseudonocardia kujensis]MCE0767629.1 gas vesicle protein [Pseudonocardia kujensis]